MNIFGSKTEGSVKEFGEMREALKRAVQSTADDRIDRADVGSSIPTPDPVVEHTPITNESKSEEFGVMSAGSTWEGKLKTLGSFRIDGECSGEIEAEHTIVVSKGAKANATLRAKRITVAGKCEGRLECSERLEILDTGHVVGELVTKALVVHEGATVEGNVRMLEVETNGNRKRGDNAKWSSDSTRDRSKSVELVPSTPLGDPTA